MLEIINYSVMSAFSKIYFHNGEIIFLRVEILFFSLILDISQKKTHSVVPSLIMLCSIAAVLEAAEIELTDEIMAVKSLSLNECIIGDKFLLDSSKMIKKKIKKKF